MQFTTVRSKEKLFGERKKWIPAILRQKMQFTTVRSKEKDYDIYLKSEKLVHSQQEHEKNVSQIMTKSQKKWFTASKSTKKMFPSYLEVAKTGSQLFRA